MAFQEESSRSLRSDEQHATEPKTVLPDGSYSTGPRGLTGLTTARFEHCLVRRAPVCAALQWLQRGASARAASGIRCDFVRPDLPPRAVLSSAPLFPVHSTKCQAFGRSAGVDALQLPIFACC